MNARPYTPGIDLINRRECPRGATSPMACMFCFCGHMTECHYPYPCDQAFCSHYDPMEDGIHT